MNLNFFNNKKVLITGGKGFLGSHLTPKLEKICRLNAPASKEYNLTKEKDVSDLFEKTKPEIVIHLATDLGNLKYLIENAGSVFYNNLMMNTLLLEYSKRNNIEKFVGIGTAFSYPQNINPPFREEDLWAGEVERDSSCYSLPKKMMLIQSQVYEKQFGLNAIHLLMTSLYGPGADNSSAIPSIIKKFDDAIKNKQKEVQFWGSGEATRDLLYVDDAAEAIIKATERYNLPEPINIGSGKEIKIKNLIETIAEIMNFDGEIIWDSTKPEGPKKIYLDSSKAEKEFDFKAKTNLKEGLRKTVNYFQSLYLSE